MNALSSTDTTAVSDIEQRVNLAGSNMLELLLFRLAPGHGPEQPLYGINVLKVREIAQMPAITPLPNAAPGMLGVVKVREQVIPVVNLIQAMGHRANGTDGATGTPKMLLITEFSRSTQGFAVEEVEEIARLDWSQVKSTDTSFSNNAITGFAQLGGGTSGQPERLVQVVDVEHVLRSVSPSTTAVDESSISVRFSLKPGAKILAADDSTFARQMIEQSLKTLGVPCTLVRTGQEAWAMLQAANARARQEKRSVRDEFGLVLTDLEMPEMDGFSLTRKIKETDGLRDVPVVVHSSLSGSATAEQSRRAGADAFVAKFVPNELAQAMHDVLKRRGGLAVAGA